MDTPQPDPIVMEAIAAAAQEMSPRLSNHTYALLHAVDSQSEFLRRVGAISSFLLTREAERENFRVGAVKCLVAMLPPSFPYIVNLIRSRDYLHAEEVHFSLFCFVGDSPAVEDHIMRQSCIALAGEYLLGTAPSQGHAKWMAAHLLGTHFGDPQATDKLIEVLTSASSEGSRVAAIGGLEERLRDERMIDRQRILSALEEAAAKDANESVRLHAAIAKGRIAGLTVDEILQTLGEGVTDAGEENGSGVDL